MADNLNSEDPRDRKPELISTSPVRSMRYWSEKFGVDSSRLAKTRSHAAVMVAGKVMGIAIAPVITPRDGEFAFRPRGAVLDTVLHLRSVVSNALPN